MSSNAESYQAILKREEGWMLDYLNRGTPHCEQFAFDHVDIYHGRLSIQERAFLTASLVEVLKEQPGKHKVYMAMAYLAELASVLRYEQELDSEVAHNTLEEDLVELMKKTQTCKNGVSPTLLREVHIFCEYVKNS